MATKNDFGTKIKAVLDKAKMPQKLAILQMPEHSAETAPHWLFWFLVIGLIALAVAMIWAHVGSSPAIQTYLPGV